MKHQQKRLGWQRLGWQDLQQFVQSHRAAFVVAPTVAAAVLVGNGLGLFNLLEWAVRDQFFLIRPQEPVEDQVVIVTIDETDIQLAKTWPIPDQALASLIRAIRQQNPRVIGLDLYRDLPEEPGHQQLVELFRTTPNLVGVEKISNPPVAPPPELKQLNQVALADLVLDDDRKVRRALLSAEDAQAGNQVKAALGVQMALQYLAQEQITPQTLDATQQKLRLGRQVFTPLRSGQAGYSREALGGYQILLNWRGDQSRFPLVSMRQVLAGEIPADLMRDRAVLIGSVAPSTNDFFETPYSNETPGVIVHANLVSQLIQSAKVGRLSLRGFTGLEQGIWIGFWAIAGTAGSWWLARFQTRSGVWGDKVLWATVGTTGLLLVGAYGAFLVGHIVPVIAPSLALCLSVIAATSAYRQQKLRETNQQLEVANQQLVDYSKTLETRVEARTAELQQLTAELEQRVQQRTSELAQSLDQLQQTQLQLIQSEKMSALGQLVAGVAHEINNPVGFIAGNLEPATDYVQDLFSLIDLYQAKYPNPDPDIVAAIKAIELDYLRDDLPRLIASLQEGTDRICNISTSLRTFSRADMTQKVPCNLHAGIDSTIMILKHRLKANADRPAIEVLTQYGNLPPVICFPGQLNQVFMNILANAIDAIDQRCQQAAAEQSPSGKIWIVTENETKSETGWVRIYIRDNGLGMPAAVQARVFEHLYTTKPVGQGTGLGLSIARQIIEEAHQGRLSCKSVAGEGTEFLIQIPLA
jgi:adenylate cyclase